MAWFSWNGTTSSCAAKAAEWILTPGTRVGLAAQGTQVLGVHLGGADTDMTYRLRTATVITSIIGSTERPERPIFVVAAEVHPSVRGTP